MSRDRKESDLQVSVEAFPLQKRQLTIQELQKLFQSKSLNLRPDFQRGPVWSRKKKQRLIDSLLRDFPIGFVYLHREEKIGKGGPVTVFRVLDGQQRLNAIFDFLADKFPTSTEFTRELNKPMRFSELPPDLRWKILKTWVDIIEAPPEMRDEDISEIFMRLQEGVPLRGPEILNAMRGDLRNRVVELVGSEPMIVNSSVSKHRFGHRYLTAQLALLEIQGWEPEHLPDNLGFKALQNLYRQQARMNGRAKQACNRIHDNLHYMWKVLKKDATLIKHRADFLSIYLFMSHLRAEYAVKGMESRIKDFVREFLIKVEQSQKGGSDDFSRFKGLRRRATERGEALKLCLEILLQNFFSKYKDVEWLKKDPQRLFGWGQKLAIYKIQDGRCKKCGKSIDFREAQFHHKVPWGKGGPTTVENGEMYCKKHHPR
jgi:hypothetical protein